MVAFEKTGTFVPLYKIWYFVILGTQDIVF